MYARKAASGRQSDESDNDSSGSSDIELSTTASLAIAKVPKTDSMRVESGSRAQSLSENTEMVKNR